MNVGNRLRRRVPEDVCGSAAALPPKSKLSGPGIADLPPPPPESDWPFLRTAGVTELLRMQAAAIEELRHRDVVRTGNAPLGDYAEYLFARAFSWKLTPNSATNYDAESEGGERYQIKARRLRNNAAGELGIMRGLPDKSFDYLAAVLFNRDFAVNRAAIIPHANVASRAAHIKHVNGWRFMLDDSVWQIAGVQDVTEAIRSAANDVDKSSPGDIGTDSQPKWP